MQGGSAITEFVGVTNREVRFTNMADFFYDAPNRDTHIVGPSISRQTGPQTYNYECNPSMAILEAREAAIKDEDGGEVAFLRFKDSRGPPTQPTALSAQKPTNDEDLELINNVKELFRERPVWQRASLEEALGPSRSGWRLATALRQISYLFLDGPWRKCYVRFGYDPRTDSSSRLLQMIDFRDPYLRSEDQRPSDKRPVDIHFRRAPSNRSQLYQLCDIDDPGIQGLLNGPCRMFAADSHTGWLTESEMESIRNQMKIKSESMRRAGLV
jgi:general transcription factor 3C polypeptide 5 (transcription factor C subunit 1)